MRKYFIKILLLASLFISSEYSTAHAEFFNPNTMEKLQSSFSQAWNFFQSKVKSIFFKNEEKKEIGQEIGGKDPKPGSTPTSTQPKMLKKYAPTTTFTINTIDHKKVLLFSQNARHMLEPTREFTTQNRAKEIAIRFAIALQKEEKKNIRSQLQPTIMAIKINKNSPDELSFLLLDKRLSALLLLWEGKITLAINELWSLAQEKENNPKMQARDALFTAFGAQELHWNQAALMAYEFSIAKKIEEQDRYLNLLTTFITKLPTNYIDILSAQAQGSWEKISPHRDNTLAIFYFLKNHLNKAENLAPLGTSKEEDKIKVLLALQSIHKKQFTPAETTLKVLTQNSSNDEITLEAKQNLARLYAMLGREAESTELYKNIALTAKNKADLLLETAYMEYKNGNYSQSLGKTIGLQSPYFFYAFQPDTPILESLNRKAICDFGGAEHALKNFQTIYGEEKNNLLRYQAVQEQSGSLYRKLIRSIATEHPYRFERYALHLPSLYAIQSSLNDIGIENKSIEKYLTINQEVKTAFFTDAGNFQEFFRQRQITKFEKILKQEISDALSSIQANMEQADLITLDIASKASRNHSLESAMNYPKPQKASEVTISHLQKVRWPYEDEIWEDEIPYLATKNADKCVDSKLAATK